jgi:outer membrane receptor protein involved in Fe transport
MARYPESAKISRGENRKMNRRTVFSVLTFAIILCVCGLVYGQETTGNISGHVNDQNGAAVANAKVTVESTDTSFSRTYQTNEEGLFTATLLPPGNYHITVEMAGFKKHVQSDVQISVNDRRSIDIALEAGGVTEVVNVTSEPSIIQQSPTQQSLVNGTQIRQLPLNNRNFVQLATLAPGVVSSNPSQIGFGGLSTVQLSINGNRTSAINWLVDGSRNVDTGSNLTLLTTPSVDAIQEFTILTSNYAPEFGRNGGGVINVVTRSGTDKFHGNLYEFVRNDAFNARDPFITAPISALSSPGNPVFKQPLRYNDFGGTIGGPVYFLNFGEGVPAIYDGHGRTYFFFSQEFRRVRSSSIPVGTVATDAQRNGVFTTTITDPTTGLPFTNNTIPTARFNANSVALLQYILRANEARNGVFDQFRRVTPVAGNFRQSMFRLDHRINSKYNLMVRYIQDNFDRTDPGGNLFQDPFILTNASGTLFPFVASGQTTTPGKNFVASVRMAFTPTIVNELAFDYAFNEIISQFTGTGLRANTPGFTSPELFPENTLGSVPNISISAFNGLTFTPPANINNPSYTWRDNLTWVKSNHTFKFGAFLSKEQKNENAQNGTHGSWSFNGSRTGNAWADFLLGLPNNYTESLREVRLQLRYNTYEFYAQDSWRVTPRLTVDFGARYSIFENPIDANNYLIAFRPDLYDPARKVTLAAGGNNIVANSGDRFNGIIFAGLNSPFGRRVQSQQYNTLGPRLGFAYDIFGNGKTVIRGGYGVYYDRTLSGIVEQNAFANPLLSPSVSIDNSAATPLSFNDPNTGTTNTALSVLSLTSTGNKFKSPQTLQYNLGIQREIMSNLFVEAAYVGSSGHNLLRQVNINAPLPRFARNGGVLARNFYRPFVGYANINERRTDADSNYNSAQFTLNKRFSHGLQFGAVYTFSKNITDSSTDRSDTIQDNLNPERERAISSFDRTHVFTANFFYELPFGKNQMWNLGSVGNAILGGFQFAGVYTRQSGTPFTITQTTGTYIRNGVSIATLSDPLDTAITVRPNLTCDPNLGRGDRTPTRWFNTNCFDPVFANSTAYGNAGRNIVRGPGINNFDLSLYRSFRFTESMNIQLRAEAFNLFNTVNYNNPVASLGSSNFGAITSARDPRIIQFGIKFNF